jgi:hypothetical protein
MGEKCAWGQAMTRLLLLVEGQSEEAFVKETLAPHLAESGVYAKPTIMLTKPLSQGGGHRGGVGKWNMIYKNLHRLLKDTDAKVSTMLDFYSLPDDFPGKRDQPAASDGYAMVEELERRFAAAVDHARFIPFLTLYEFETLVFSSPRTVATHFELPRLEVAIQSAVDGAGSPELINGGGDTHPKERLKRLLKRHRYIYGQVLDGGAILNEIGIGGICAACQHFSAWVGQLESLGALDDANQQ